MLTINSVYFAEHSHLLMFLMRAQSFLEGRKILMKYYSDCLTVGFILYEYFGIVSAFASYTTPPGARKLYSQTYFTARNHIVGSTRLTKRFL
jgi:hypothetical protein